MVVVWSDTGYREDSAKGGRSSKLPCKLRKMGGVMVALVVSQTGVLIDRHGK